MAETRETLVYDFQIDSSSYSNVEQTNSKLDKTVGILKKITAGVGVAFAGRKIINFAKEAVLGADALADSRRVFESYTRNVGEDHNRMIRDMKEASRGAIDEATLMQKTIYAKNLGIKTDLSDVLELTQKQAYLLGRDQEQFFNVFIDSVSRRSSRGLAQMGIIVREAEAQKQLARDLNKSVQDLTESEKARAYELAAMKGLQDNVLKSGIVGFDNLNDNIKAINGTATHFKNLLGDFILPQVNQWAQYLGDIARDLQMITQSNREIEVNKEILVIQEKLTVIAEKRRDLQKEITQISINSIGILTKNQIENAGTLLQQNRFTNELTSVQVNYLKEIVSLQNEVNDTRKQEIGLQNLIQKQQESDKRANIEKVKNTIETRREEEKITEEKDEQIKKDEELIRLEKTKKDLALEYSEFIKKFEIGLIEDKKQQIIAQNQFEMEQSIKKFALIGKSEEEIRALFLEKQNQMIAGLSDEKEDDIPLTPVELMLERMEKNIKEKSGHIIATTEAFNNANEKMITDLVEKGKASVSDYTKILAQETKARLISIATQSATMSLFALAEGLFNPLLRKEKFAASAMYAKTAVVAGLGAGAVNATFGLSSSNAGAGASSERSNNTTREIREQMVREKEIGTNLTVVFQGGVIGTDGKEIGRFVANQISKDNRIRDVIVRNE